MRWNLEWLRTFKAIYETGTLSAAAQELFMSQPGVSLHLNALEDFTGTRLFERSARRMLPTEKGKMLYNFVLDPLTKLESGEQHFHKRAQNERVTVSIGMCFETFQYTFEKHIASLPFNLIVRFGDYAQMQHDLETGLLDFIVTPHADPQPKLEYVPFSKERIVLIAGNGTDTEELQSLLGEEDWKKAVLEGIPALLSGFDAGQVAGKQLAYTKPEGAGEDFIVAAQYPAAGTRVKRNSTVYLYDK